MLLKTEENHFVNWLGNQTEIPKQTSTPMESNFLVSKACYLLYIPSDRLKIKSKKIYIYKQNSVETKGVMGT